MSALKSPRRFATLSVPRRATSSFWIVWRVALGEHLRLAGDLVRLDLPSGVDLRIERFAVGVVPVLADPAERRVVGPRRGQLGVVETLDHFSQRCRWNRKQPRKSDVAVEAGQIYRQLVEQQAQERRVPFSCVRRTVGAERGREVAELSVALAVPPSRDDVRLRQARGFELTQEHESIDERRCRFLLGLGEQAVLRTLQLLGVLRLLRAGVLVDPRFDALAPLAVHLVEPCVTKRNRETVPPVCLVVDREQELGPQAPNRLREDLLGFRSQGHARLFPMGNLDDLRSNEALVTPASGDLDEDLGFDEFAKVRRCGSRRHLHDFASDADAGGRSLEQAVDHAQEKRTGTSRMKLGVVALAQREQRFRTRDRLER